MKRIILSIFMLTMIIGACNQEEVLPKTELAEIINQKSTVSDTEPCISGCLPLSFYLIAKNPTSIYISWIKHPTRGTYNAEISTSSDFSTIIQSSGFVAELSSHTFENLIPDTHYYVRVVYYTKRAGNITIYSPTYSLHTHDGIPDLSNAIVSYNKVYDSWYYKYRYTDLISWTNHISETNFWTGNECNYANGGLRDCSFGFENEFYANHQGTWMLRSSLIDRNNFAGYSQPDYCLTYSMRLRVRTVWPDGSISNWSDYFYYQRTAADCN